MPAFARAAVAALLGLLVTGCSLANQIGTTAPTGITQQLLVRSLERALSDLDVARASGKPVAVEVTVQAGNEGFVKDYVTTWLKAHGVHVAPDAAEEKLKLFVQVYGTDKDQTLIGVPAFMAPIVNVPVPEIALFKWVRNRGVAELRMWALDKKGEVLMDAPAPGVGRAKYDDYTILIFFGFTYGDINKHPEAAKPPK